MNGAVVIAGTRSGVGKTTIATGIMAALRKRGYTVQPFKTGPDYIDPSYHSRACGRPSRNLDTWLLSHATVTELFQRAAAPCDIAVIEGVMGLYDGRSGGSAEGSTAELAKLLNAPVVLVVDVAKTARSIAAEVLGFVRFDPQLTIAAVILNNVGSPRHFEICAEAVRGIGLPVLGHLRRADQLKLPERHLGLVPTTEGPAADAWFDLLADTVEKGIDLERLVAIAQQARPPQGAPTLFPGQSIAPKTAVAVAMDQAFSFYYEDSLDLLRAAGAELIPFSPISDSTLPAGVGGVYIGGGFPELFARELAANTAMHRALTQAAARGISIYAECGGLMYLGEGLVDFEGRRHAMVGLVPASSVLQGQRLTLGYREVETLVDGPLARKGQRLRGHEFHWSRLEREPAETQAAYLVTSQEGRPEGFAVNSCGDGAAGQVWASYIHVHLASDGALAPRFVARCARAQAPF